MNAREKTIFERALYLCANEHGYTREQQIAWLNDDKEWEHELTYPKPCSNSDVGMPWIQVTRTTTVGPS